MNVYVTVYEMHVNDGRVIEARADVRTEHSPREGYDNEKLRELELKLSEILTEGLNDALEGEP